MLALAAADGVAQAAALEAEAAAGARRRQEPRLDEQRAHEACPEEHEADDEWTLHFRLIGRERPLDKILS